MNELITLVGDTSRRDVFAALRSVGRAEFYAAQAVDYHPELVFVLADCLDYADETLLLHDDRLYRVLRTYRTGQALEIVVVKASAEEVEIYGSN